jgi:hypothetical protein
VPDIHHLIGIRAPRERVYAALTTVEGIHNWWTRDAELDGAAGTRGADRGMIGACPPTCPPKRKAKAKARGRALFDIVDAVLKFAPT